MIPADPYHQISPSLEWHGDGASYPFLNPSNFIEYPTIYDLSRPHLPYIARYPQDPSIRLDFSCQHHHPFRLDLREYMCYKTWMEKQLNLYAVWDHFARDINLHVSLILSQLAMGFVTHHTCHGCVTDFRPILGNPVEVTHMTSPGTVYISHAKGTYFPLARISSSIPL